MFYINNPVASTVLSLSSPMRLELNHQYHLELYEMKMPCTIFFLNLKSLTLLSFRENIMYTYHR